MSTIIGIDPGSRITGYGLIGIEHKKLRHIECGGIHSPLRDTIEKRLHYIYNQTKELLARFRPDHASIEDLFFAKNAKSALLLGQVRGVILMAIAEASIPYSTYTPREVKKAVTGYGNASKGQIQYMVSRLLRLKEAAFEDASDALAIAICHAHTSQKGID